MNENENTNVELDGDWELTAEELAQYSDGEYQPVQEPETEPQTETPEQTETAETEETQTTDTEETSETEEIQEQTTPETFDLKFLGETKQYTRDEVTALAQKGMNYDRILQQRDQLQQYRTQHEGILGDLTRISQLFGKDPAELLSGLEKNLLRQQGKTEAEAEAELRASRAERQIQAVQQREQAQQQKQDAVRQRQEQDIQEFVRRYPNLDYKTIPQSVWNQVRQGSLLVDAYSRYEMDMLRAENQRLKQQDEARQQNEKNKANSLGSMKSGPAKEQTDPFLEELFRD